MAIEGEGRVFELVRCEDAAGWLGQRARGVGGSDVAAIMGLSKYKGAYAVWAEKAGLSLPEDISGRPAVEWGNRLEPLVAEKYAEGHPGSVVRRVNAVCRSIARPWAQASLDYEVRDPALGWGVLEIKTVGWRSMGDWDEGVPLYYQTQVVHYLSVTGRPFADVAVLKAGQEYAEFRVMRDEEDIAAVEAAVDGFWERVESRDPPEMGGSAADMHAVFGVNRSAAAGVEEVGQCPELDAWLAAKAECDRAAGELTLAAGRLKARIGKAGGIASPKGRVKWVRGTRRKLDRKGFERDHPGALAGYEEEVPYDGGLRWSPSKEV